ncbi:(2Fe-2S)-binding protein [Litoreibacter janthinus]|uniref:Nicotinate dehydrogenase subunit A n=1 Tax=Litoreibacter janthinus TaxID=670154 RepID=A0A1I6GX46_9RHOB|nr:(2Fe-2S)-binding protein [Litoreibacter janthinus]SFR46833.1 nicotinate dehydrogenase subunit A [Litoreibacter janthinus]
MTVSLTINGKLYEISSEPDTPLIYVLRDELGLKGTKLGCGLEQCGACAVLIDGQAVLSCVSAVEAFKGKEVTTIEAIGDTELGRRVQEAFVETSAAQCGYCTAGLVVATTALLYRSPKPDDAGIALALSPHLCRCGSHPRVLRAVKQAADR